jgi:hypothetical protein
MLDRQRTSCDPENLRQHIRNTLATHQEHISNTCDPENLCSFLMRVRIHRTCCSRKQLTPLCRYTYVCVLYRPSRVDICTHVFSIGPRCSHPICRLPSRQSPDTTSPSVLGNKVRLLLLIGSLLQPRQSADTTSPAQLSPAETHAGRNPLPVSAT